MIGTKLEHYEVTAHLGSGGMGDVFQATDTKLGRSVAIKFLPEAFSQDGERLARFKREARVLASLNHTGIAAIHGLEEINGRHFLVMELAPGETLAERIVRGAISVDEAMRIARQIAEALQAAHEKGIVHRDLKPANIRVTPEDKVKVLDFGLAKAMEPVDAPSPIMSHSPTITNPAMTVAGVILGTAAYMSPEQARGKGVDKRTDIWAFGCVLYEMLAGRPAFEGEDVMEVLGAVVRLEPDWKALPSDVPPAVRTLLQNCLVKDRQKRIADISTALFVFDSLASLAAPTGPSPPALPPPESRRRRIAPVVTALLAAAAAGTIGWMAARSSLPPPRVSRLPLAPSAAAALSINGNDRDLAITPDGSRLVYVGNNATQLFVRSFDALDPMPVFTGAPRGPFISPDGQWVGFVDGLVLKKMALAGGPALSLAMLDGTPRGAVWAPDDTIIIATDIPVTGLLRVPASGGLPMVLTRPDLAGGETDHYWPELLPDGRSVLFTIIASTGGLESAQVAVLDLRTGMHKILVRGGSHAHYVPSGHLIYAAAGTLVAVAFDLAGLEPRGTPVPVVPNVVTTVRGAVDAVVAGDGTLAYVAGTGIFNARTLAWVDRYGRETPIPAPPRQYLYPRLSPDGMRVALVIPDQERDIWIWDLARAALTRFTFGSAEEFYPVWTPDGRRLIFSSTRAGARNLYWQSADGTGSVERLTTGVNNQFPDSIASDGKRLVLSETTPETGNDLELLLLDGKPRAAPLVHTPGGEFNGEISPDGRWLAYQSDESGRTEIFVRPFPEVDTGRWQVSTAGGTRPLWARNGRELFYVSPNGAIMRVGVESGVSWSATTPAVAVKAGYSTASGGFPGRSYDIAPDGQRFLLLKEGASDQNAASVSVIIVQNWLEELQRLVPVR